MHEPLITVVGHVAAPPRLRTLESGVAVTDFRLATTPRRRDKEGEWADGETIWFGVTAWRVLAENVAGSIKKGDRVIATGLLTTRTWENEQGERRSNLEVDARSVGLELSRGTAAYVKAPALVTDVDPMVSSGEVDPDTGEVLLVPRFAAEPEPEPEPEPELASVGA